ncbi:MAG TPA: GerMN domain-containing protein [Lapillicoccus sp.]|nr:GerMN domain-containing protein [Lapillicoccus sp.]
MRAAALPGLITVLVGSLALLGACGLPSSSTPVEVPPAEVPYGLLESATASPSPTVSPGVLLSAATIYLADAQQQLVAVHVQIPSAPAATMLQSLLDRLAEGPSERERARGLVTDLVPGSTIMLRSISAGTADIELETTNQDPSPSKLPIAVGQIVLTATSIVGIDRVVFVRAGTVLPVPGPDGSRTLDPLTSVNYTSLLAPGQPPVERTIPMAGPTDSVTTATR